MFFPEQMTEVELVLPADKAVAVTGVLAEAGVFHQIDSSYASTELELESGDGWQQRSLAFAGLERRLLSIMELLGVEEGTPESVDAPTATDAGAAEAATDQLEKRVQTVTGDLAKQRERLELLQGYIQQLEPIRQVEAPVNVLREAEYVFSMLGIIPVDNLERLEMSLGHVPFTLLTLWRDNRRAVVLLAGMQQHSDVLDRAARSAYLNPLSLPEEYQGTPQQIIAHLHSEIDQVHQKMAEEKGKAAKLRDQYRERLQALLWRVRTGRMLANALARFGKLRYTYLTVGWVPTSRLTTLIAQLKQVSEDILVETSLARRGRATLDVPVSLKNPGILRAFQQLVTVYGRPRYKEIDPTLFIAITFPILFGAMFGDVGHGFVLALLGALLASRRIRALRSMAALGTVIAFSGLSAMIFGFLYGSVFGFEHVLPALWLQPIENILQILIVAVAVGVVLLSVGFLTGILNAWVARDWGWLLFEHNGIAGLLLYWSLLGLAAGMLLPGFPVPGGVFIGLAAVSGLAVMFSEPLGRLVEGRRPLIEGGVGMYAVQIFFEMFETLIGLVSNSLSYVRVGAFAVAHAGLSSVIFILAELFSPGRGIVYWIVAILGNLFVIGFEGLIVGIQTLRLEYYEFFSKFFTGGGTRFRPLVMYEEEE
jgi:V/A-type H+/Na+-transporting ATPase subunit I